LLPIVKGNSYAAAGLFEISLWRIADVAFVLHCLIPFSRLVHTWHNDYGCCVGESMQSLLNEE
jgi:hypothetical protein